MIQSLFILSPVGEVLIERHFRGVVTSRSVCDHFWEQAAVSINHLGGISSTTSLLLNQPHYDTVPPVMEVSESEHGMLYVFSALRDGLSYLAVCPGEVSPLLIIEFLHRIADIFVDYFGSPADESAIKENFATVYHLLEELQDYGFPLTTEPNALKAMIRPPTVMSKLLQNASTVNEQLPSGAISNMPWRAANVHHTNNEIFMDIIEEVDAIVGKDGSVVSSDVSGRVQCQSHLSGVPDLLLTFKDPHLMDDCSFHPCVRYQRFEEDSVVSFVPPDGDFELLKYRIPREHARTFQPPLFCQAQWSAPIAQNKGRIHVAMSVTSLSSLIFSSAHRGSLVVEEVFVLIPFPKHTRSTSNLTTNMGSVIYDEASKVAKWTLGKMDATSKATLSCSFACPKEGSTPPNLSMHWKVPLASVSGISVSGLNVTGESYRPYKGVRNITRSGTYQLRCTG